MTSTFSKKYPILRISYIYLDFGKMGHIWLSDLGIWLNIRIICIYVMYLKIVREIVKFP